MEDTKQQTILNKQIKLRAWNEGDKEMVQIDSYHWEEWGTPGDDLNEERSSDMSPLMLYTNLKDSDGIEIYEGDILEIEIECITGYKCKYKWTCPSIFEAFHGYQELQDIINKEGYKKAIVKVIGHIYK